MKKTTFSSMVLTGLALVITACAKTDGFHVFVISFAEPVSFQAFQEKAVGSDALHVRSDAMTGATQALAKSGTLFVGDKTFTDRISDEPTFYTWFISGPCANLPQGSNISIRYELYDANHVVIQKNSAVVPKISTC